MDEPGIDMPREGTDILISVEVTHDPLSSMSDEWLGAMLRTLARHALKACFFVDPFAPAFVEDDLLGKAVRAIVDAGQDIQLLLAAPVPSGRRALVIANARERLISAGALEPIGFRGADYPDDGLLADLAALGFLFDSSHQGQPASDAGGLPGDQISPVRRHGVIELPVTRIVDGDGFRLLRTPDTSFSEIRSAMVHAEGHGMPLVVMAVRGSELWEDDQATPAGRRFEELCIFLSQERKRFPTAFLADLRNVALDRPSIPLPDAPLRRVGRMIGQAWSDRMGDRLG